MEGKFWVFIVAIALIAGIFTAVQYSGGVDRINADLQEIKGKVEQMQASAATRKTEWAKIETLYQKLQTAQAKIQPLQAQKDEVQKKLRLLEGDFKYMVSSIRSAVDKTRLNGPGEAFAELKLADGRVLKDAKIRKVEENQLSFIHSEGFGTVAYDLLPAEVQAKYDMGPNGLANSLVQAEKELFAPPAAAGKPSRLSVVPPASSSSSMPAASGGSSSTTAVIDNARVKQLKLKKVDLETKIQAAKNAATGYEQQAKDNYTNGDIAKSRGTPAAKYWTAAQAAAQQAQVFKSQIIALEAELKKLEIEIESESKSGN